MKVEELVELAKAGDNEAFNRLNIRISRSVIQSS